VGICDLAGAPSLVSSATLGATVVAVRHGIFPFACGTSTDALTIADLLNDVYLLDDQTVGRLPGSGRPVAGTLIKVDGTNFFVWVGPGFSKNGTDNGGGTAWLGIGSTENVAAPGAISVLTHETLLTTIDGTDAFTLANGLFVGQEKIVRVSADGANTPVGTITPATPFGFATVSSLGLRGDLAVFVWTASGWIIRSLNLVTQT
jgi:hypothetical protein